MSPAPAHFDPAVDALLGVVALLAAYGAGLTVIPWIWILAHEAAHVLAARATGALPIEAHVGHGSHVLVVRCLGTRWNLRLWPTHGWVNVRRPDVGWSRGKEIALSLAGPIASTVAAIGAVVLAWTNAGFSSDHLHGLERALEGAIDLCAFMLVIQGLSVWMPGEIEIEGSLQPSDLENVARTIALDSDDAVRWVESIERTGHEQDAWEQFLDGQYDAALATWRRRSDVGDEGIGKAAMLPIYIWPVHGAASAIADCDVALAHIGQARRDAEAQSPVLPRDYRTWLAEIERVVELNRAFLAQLAGGTEDRRRADEFTRADLQRRPKDAPALRTRGFVDLELGDVKTGVARLERAWKLEEDAWLRAVCALYLAYGHALRGDARRARTFLAKCRRLHARSPLLPVLAPRIELLCETARGAPARA